MTVAVVVAAGSGTRLGRVGPKALVELDGRALVAHAVAALAGSVDAVIVVAPPGAEAAVAAAVRGSATSVVAVVAGGSTRARSVGRGLAAVAGSERVVAVHDAARPLVAPALLDACVEALVHGADAAAPGVPLADTVKQVVRSPAGDDAEVDVLGTVDREGLRAVQTPQVFRRSVLERAHAAARADRRLDAATDDLELAEAIGARVRLVPGDVRNLKVTWPHDLVIAAALLRR